MDKKEWLTSGEMAEHCMVSRDTVKRWVREGILEAITTPGGRNRITRKTAIRFLREHNMPVPSDLLHETATRVLIVDDNSFVRTTVKRFFQFLPGDFDIETASGGIEGIMKIGLFKPTLLVLDLMMPEVDGFKVIGEVRSNSDIQDMKILIFSGYLTPEVIERVQEAGADEVLAKPFQPAAFLQKVSHLLDIELPEKFKGNPQDDIYLRPDENPETEDTYVDSRQKA